MILELLIISDLALTQAVRESRLRADLKETVQDVILKRHRHQYEEEHENDLDVRLMRTLADFKRRSTLNRDRGVEPGGAGSASTPKKVILIAYKSRQVDILCII